MATITFKAKISDAITTRPGEVLYRLVHVPKLERRHCDMTAFRSHPKYGGLANSDLFPNILARIKRDVTNAGGWIRLDQLPENVSVDTSGFLAIVTITV